MLYGTAWSDTTLLARQRAINLEIEQRTRQKLHFEYDWRTLAAINPAYRTFVEQEIARLGEEHLAIQTQYYLRPISGAGYFLNDLQHALLSGNHAWQDTPRSGDWYIAGMDVAGEERPAQVGADALYAGETRSHKRDSTVITIGRVKYTELNLPALEVVHQQWWTGMPYLEQYAATAALVEQWNVRALVVDATGLGAGMASLLASRCGTERVLPFTFTRASKSRLAYHLLALLNSSRLKLYSEESAPPVIAAECRQQLKMARYRLPAPEILDMYVDPSDGHDDFLISLALLAEGLTLLSQPAASTLIRPRRLYDQEGRF